MSDEIYYRVENHPGWDEGTMMISMIKYQVVRRTKAGAWIREAANSDLGQVIQIFGAKERFVLDNARRRLAYPTKELAIDSFVHRKRKQIQHLSAQLWDAKQALKAVSTEGFEFGRIFRVTPRIVQGPDFQ